jgi:hypothetical protein
MLFIVCIAAISVISLFYAMSITAISELDWGSFVDQEFRMWDFHKYREEVDITGLGNFRCHRHGNKIKIGNDIYNIYWKPFVGIILKNENHEFVLKN